ncbi:MAG: hypothetical protein KF789_09945 [Bdellovibrionaceae bacterium]|nr:hypothetical protein [Pseudobdellovibrionaceae bacterium]
MDVAQVSESLMLGMILFHAALLVVPCLWLSFGIMAEEWRAHEISWKIQSFSKPLGGLSWA